MDFSFPPLKLLWGKDTQTHNKEPKCLFNRLAQFIYHTHKVEIPQWEAQTAD